MFTNIKTAAARLSVVTGMAGIAVLSGIGLAGTASATPADPVETAFTDMSAKITLYGGLVVGLVVLSVLIFLGVKYLRKASSHA